MPLLTWRKHWVLHQRSVLMSKTGSRSCIRKSLTHISSWRQMLLTPLCLKAISPTTKIPIGPSITSRKQRSTGAREMGTGKGWLVHSTAKFIPQPQNWQNTIVEEMEVWTLLMMRLCWRAQQWSEQRPLGHSQPQRRVGYLMGEGARVWSKTGEPTVIFK